MAWLAHFVGGPLDGEIEAVHGYWPWVAKEVDREYFVYHLVSCVIRGGVVEPHTPLIYVWDGLSESDAAFAVDAYLSKHRVESGMLDGSN